MPKLPAEVRRALAALNDEKTDPARLDRLAARIEQAASPIFAERLSGRASAPWWDLPATWAATLIPASLAIAALSLLVLWRVTPPKPTMEVSDASLLRAAAPIGNPAAVDQAINELVTPQPRPRR